MHARAGQVDAFRQIMQRCNQRLFRVARAVLNDDAEAEDALQEAWVLGFRHLDQFRGESRLSSWLTRIVLNECYRRLRRRRTTVPVEALEAAQVSAQVIEFPARYGMEDPARGAARAQLRGLLEAAIDELPEDFRVVFIMRAIEQYSTQETAVALDIEPATVKTRLHRARQRLREALDEQVEASLDETYPFLGRRCGRMADAVIQRLGLETGD